MSLAASAALAGGPPITVLGMNDAAVDRPAIQAAIDAVGEGGTVRLDGVFQLDGEALLITKEMRLRGLTVDNDADGMVNEDWIDGADNDADGKVDEDGWDAHLVGLVDDDGVPLPEIGRTVVFNRAIFVRGLDTEVEDLRIQDIRFSGHFRAITLEPDTGSTGGTVCENLFPTTGSLEDPRVERNRFDNNDRAVELEGATEGARIRDNLIEDSNISIIVQGLAMGCPLVAGGFDRFPIGQPIETRVEGNDVTGTDLIGVFSFGSIDTRIRNNALAQGLIGIITESDPGLEIKDNLIDGADFGLDLIGPADDAEVKGNEINGLVVGVFVDFEATDWVIRNNTFGASGFTNVFLDPTSSNNLVIVGPDVTVLDFGVDNTIIVQ